jgi:hypothetical protein
MFKKIAGLSIVAVGVFFIASVASAQNYFGMLMVPPPAESLPGEGTGTLSGSTTVDGTMSLNFYGGGFSGAGSVLAISDLSKTGTGKLVLTRGVDLTDTPIVFSGGSVKFSSGFSSGCTIDCGGILQGNTAATINLLGGNYFTSGNNGILTNNSTLTLNPPVESGNAVVFSPGNYSSARVSLDAGNIVLSYGTIQSVGLTKTGTGALTINDFGSTSTGCITLNSSVIASDPLGCSTLEYSAPVAGTLTVTGSGSLLSVSGGTSHAVGSIRVGGLSTGATSAATPEPGAMLLLLSAGVMGLIGLKWRRKK